MNEVARMAALKAQWSVRAGLYPGEAMFDHTKTWLYTSTDFTEDGHKRGNRFFEKQRLALEYANKLATSGHNWVQLEYLWM